MIPEDWESRRIDTVCRLINGRGFKPFEWQNMGLPIIRIQNLNGSDDFNFYTGVYDTKLEVEPGQLLFAWSGSRGTSFGPHIWHGPLGLLNYHTWKVQVHETEIKKEFFLYALRQLTTFIEGKAHGASALVHTQKWEMESFQFPLPPTKAEQEAIAEALSDADKLLEALEKLIIKKRAIKQAAMQQLLTGKTRLPRFSPSGTGGCIHEQGVPIGYKHTEAGVIPSEWQAMRVGALFRVEAGGDFDPARSSNVQSDSYPYPIYANSLSQKGLYGFCNYAKSQSGSITVTARGTLGKSFYRDIPFIAIGRLLVLEPKVSMDARFFSEYINYGVHFAVENTGVPQLTAPQVARYLLPVPPEPEQRAIATVLSDMDTEITALERRRDKTHTIKQGMMQQLLTGRVRLVSAQEGNDHVS